MDIYFVRIMQTHCPILYTVNFGAKQNMPRRMISTCTAELATFMYMLISHIIMCKYLLWQTVQAILFIPLDNSIRIRV